MKSKTYLLILYLCILQFLFTGCSKEEEPRVQAVWGQADIDRAVMEGSNVAVVNDTVVDIFSRPETRAQKVVTQALYNQPVQIIEKKEGWFNVKVVDGSTGWVKSAFINTTISSIKREDFISRIVITAKTSYIFSHSKGGIVIREVVMGTELFSIGERNGRFEVVLPDGGTGWISGGGTIELSLSEKIPQTSAEDFATTAERFKGAIYLWGGTSSWKGVDSPGLVYICSRINGVDLPRNIASQMKYGKKISIANVKTGDLIFLGADENSSSPSSVGIFIGNSQFIYANMTQAKVITSSLDDEFLRKRVLDVRRIF